MRSRLGFCCIFLLLLLPLSAWAFTSAELASEIITDPEALGYAAFVTTGNDSGLADALNLARVGAGYVVSKGVVKRDELLGAWADVIDGIPAITDATIKAKWTWRLQTMLVPKDTIDYSSALFTGFASDMIADELQTALGTITTEIVDARTKRQGSRAEVLWGTGTVITLRDISLALRDSQ
jgi:hypothetical protein